jgi:hypothetical protein
MDTELELLKQNLRRRKQEIIREGLKKLPEDYINLKKQIDEHMAQQTRASNNLFAEAKATDTSNSTIENKTKV